jgi:FkbM family methyltransferase
MIHKHLRTNWPMIELGGSLGGISTLVRPIIGPSQRHIVVEANPAVTEICRTNAGRYADEGSLELVSSAVRCSGKTVRFSISRDIHTSSNTHRDDKRDSVDAPSITLRALHERLGAPQKFALASDIEGAEYEVFENEPELLKNILITIVKLHRAEYPRRGKSMDKLISNGQSAGLSIIDHQGDIYVFRRQ